MAETETAALTLFLLLTLFLVLINSVIAGPNGFSMKIFHRDSIESPLYPGNLTQGERIQRLVEQSKARTRYLGSMISGNNRTDGSIHPNIARFPVVFEGSFYIAMVGIDCVHCFHQDEPPFPYKSSSTYSYLPCDNHPLCERGKCLGPACTYNVSYASGSTSYGILAREKFTVNSDNGALETLNEVFFGCGLDQENFGLIGSGHEQQIPDYITGILGIGGGPMSFVRQLGALTQGKFEYCFQPWIHGTASNTFLRFGSDVRIRGGGQGVSTTPMFFSPKTPTLFYLDLQDISVANRRIGFEPGSFALRQSGRGGCFIDSGSPWSVLHTPKYTRVRDAVVQYFAGLGVQPMNVGKYGFDLCFLKPEGFDNYPKITFHFQGADLAVDEPEGGFFVTDHDFCLAILPWDKAFADAIIGAIQQINYRILYDINGGALSFAKEECHIGA
ncbi:Peptidase A1 [Macleaya cordata]|uniref:Peptidase A1 n=1 Tax=Macleaya cordata TaxID=56857 RepID=A0A200QX77_MACCD|nr:Peptidase A1 [Macleaya cordata]